MRKTAFSVKKWIGLPSGVFRISQGGSNPSLPPPPSFSLPPSHSLPSLALPISHPRPPLRSPYLPLEVGPLKSS